MKRIGFALLCSAFLGTAAPTSAQQPPLDESAASTVLDFWAQAEEGEGEEANLVAENATLGMMGLGGSYDPETMGELVSHCDLVALIGSSPVEETDPTNYLWALIECPSEAGVDTIPVGFGVLEGMITQISVDLFTPVSVDRSLLPKRDGN